MIELRKPAIFAGIGMLVGAVSVAALTAFLPGEGKSVSVSPTTMQLAAAHVATDENANNPIITGPRSASRPAAKRPARDMVLASVGPADEQPGATALTHQEVVTIGKGGTLLGALVEAGVERQDAHGAIEALRPVYNPRGLRPGDEITITFEVPGNEESPVFQGFSLEPNVARTVLTARDQDGAFTATEINAPLTDETLRFEGTITSSLFEAAQAAGLSVRTTAELIRIFSFDVDFQRDIQVNDSFEVLVDRQVTAKGDMVGDPVIRFASMTLSGTRVPLYRFEDSDGFVDYYNEKGQSVRKTLLRTPINGARLSSSFGMRRHPILGYSKMHAGSDFAAPTGTPIYAAGDGVVNFAGRKGGYGNYIQLRHTSEYSTAYAHMSRFASGMKQGARVRQGDVIGYVGTTGRSTGPHLHYEVLKAGRQVNPMSIKFPSGKMLSGKALKAFQQARVALDQTYASLPNKAATIALAQDSTTEAGADKP